MLNGISFKWSLSYFLQAARLADWLPQDQKQMPRVSHVGFGLVLGLDGKRFRTRASDVVRLVDLLDEAKARSKQGLIDRGLYSISDSISSSPSEFDLLHIAFIGREDEWDAEELDLAAEALGYGAVKYMESICIFLCVEVCLCSRKNIIILLMSDIPT